ncbi:MAG: 50S ribosomal protein L25 [Pyrinomonadaceae bacterium]|nr:50S ribosomal protein L25 [Pyrinomonadaceae bacterium]
MAEKFVVKAEVREGRGTNFARRLRREGKIPANVYGGEGGSIAITANLKDLAAIIRSDTGANTLFSLDIEGVGESRVIFQDRQIDPVRGRLLHADLRRLAKGEKIEITVPINLIGSPIGVRDEGGLLEQQLREIRVLVLPSKIPESIDVDVEELAANESVHVSDISADDDIEILDSPELLVASVVFVKEEVEEVEEIEEGLEPGIVGEEDEDGETVEGDQDESTDGDGED